MSSQVLFIPLLGDKTTEVFLEPGKDNELRVVCCLPDVKVDGVLSYKVKNSVNRYIGESVSDEVGVAHLIVRIPNPKATDLRLVLFLKYKDSSLAHFTVPVHSK